MNRDLKKIISQMTLEEKAGRVVILYRLCCNIGSMRTEI